MIENSAAPQGVPALLRLHGGRIGLSLGICGLMVWLLLGRLSAIEPAEVAQAFRTLPPHAWGLALVATAISFWAVGHYDAVIHRHFATGIAQTRSRKAGICAIAVSQTIGLGVISGAVLRWRMLPEIGPWRAVRLTAAVALSFLAAWAMVTALTLVILPGAPFKAPAAIALCAGSLLALVALAQPQIGKGAFRWPNLFTLRNVLALCVVDTLAAALAFYALCPPGVDIGFTLLLPAFLLALGAGLVSGSPGGMGAFEMTLLALLPEQPEAGLLAAVLAWRLIYFAVPAIVGAGLAIRGPRSLAMAGAQAAQDGAGLGQADAGLLARAPIAELQILRQGEHRLFGTLKDGIWVGSRTPHFVIGLFGPLTPSKTALGMLSNAARDEARRPVIYKADPRLAASARARGFHVTAIAREALIAPVTYRIDTANRAGLRRKLRRAEAAGISVHSQPPAPDWAALTSIASDWATSHGGERGFSMGRFSKQYVQGQRLYVAQANGVPIAFASFHQGPAQWTLDLMRHRMDVPSGTMHLLVQTAIDDAVRNGVPNLSLAAVPDFAPAKHNRLTLWLFARMGVDMCRGLEQFKSAFAPRWEPRYLCLPKARLLPLALWELSRAIRHPAPLRTQPLQDIPTFWPNPQTSAPLMTQIDHDDAEYAFASVR